jgi:hypothetical protein
MAASNRLGISGTLTLLYVVCVPVAPAIALATDPAQFHVEAGAQLPTLFASIDADMNRALDAKLFAGTYGTGGYGIDLHLLYPLTAPFYIGGSLSYKAGTVHDYFLGTTTRYVWSVDAAGYFGIIWRPWHFLQAYAGAGVGMVTLRTGGPLSPDTYVGPEANAEIGADFLFFDYLAEGPRVRLSFSPIFGPGGSVSSYGCVSFGVQLGYSH